MKCHATISVKALAADITPLARVLTTEAKQGDRSSISFSSTKTAITCTVEAHDASAFRAQMNVLLQQLSLAEQAAKLS